MKGELYSMAKHELFGLRVNTRGRKLVGHRWVFVHKRNNKNEDMHYKVRLVTQGFSHHPGIDYE